MFNILTKHSFVGESKIVTLHQTWCGHWVKRGLLFPGRAEILTIFHKHANIFIVDEFVIKVDLTFGSNVDVYSRPGYSYAIEKTDNTLGWTKPAVDEFYNLGYVDELAYAVDCVRNDVEPRYSCGGRCLNKNSPENGLSLPGGGDRFSRRPLPGL